MNKYLVTLYETVVFKRNLVIEAPDTKSAENVALGVFDGSLDNKDDNWERVNQLDSGVSNILQVSANTVADAVWNEFYCDECGASFSINDDGTTNHVNEDGEIDYALDADHVPYSANAEDQE